MILDISKVKTLIPYIGSFVIFCGFLKLNIYYNHFNISISDYIEISEVLTLFLSDAIKYSFIILLVFFFSFITESLSEIETRELLNNEILRTDYADIRLKKFIISHPVLPIVTIIAIIFTILTYFFDNKNLPFVFRMTVVIFIFLLVNYFMFEFKRKYKLVFGKYLDSTYNNLLIILSIFFIYIINSAYQDIDVCENENTKSISFNNEGKVIKSDKTLIYLGQTKNYLFMYNKRLKETLIFSRNNLKDVLIK